MPMAGCHKSRGKYIVTGDVIFAPYPEARRIVCTRHTRPLYSMAEKYAHKTCPSSQHAASILPGRQQPLLRFLPLSASGLYNKFALLHTAQSDRSVRFLLSDPWYSMIALAIRPNRGMPASIPDIADKSASARSDDAWRYSKCFCLTIRGVALYPSIFLLFRSISNRLKLTASHGGPRAQKPQKPPRFSNLN